MTARVQPGMLGQDFEDQLNIRGFTCGHSPQSVRCTTVGGWVAPRGVGVYSSKYGKIEHIVRAMEVVLPDGSVARTKNIPVQSCGPDMNQLFIGSEGCFGVFTELTIQIRKNPEYREYIGFGMPTFEAGVRACQEIMTNDMFPACMRLYDSIEAAGAFKELGYEAQAGVEHALYFGSEGNRDLVELEVKYINEICKANGGIERPGFSERWFRKRMDTTFLKQAYMLKNGIGDAIECCASYKNLTAMHDRMLAYMTEAGTDQVFGHGSHFYKTGGNLYIIWAAFAEDEREIESKYWRIMDAAMKAVLEVDSAIGHHHGIGVNKGPWIHLNEPTMWPVVQKIKATLDPLGIMNPGKLGL